MAVDSRMLEALKAVAAAAEGLVPLRTVSIEGWRGHDRGTLVSRASWAKLVAALSALAVLRLESAGPTKVDDAHPP